VVKLKKRVIFEKRHGKTFPLKTRYTSWRGVLLRSTITAVFILHGLEVASQRATEVFQVVLDKCENGNVLVRFLDNAYK
jgi:hypothetical protein